MSMIAAENHCEISIRSNGYRFAFTFVVSAFLTFIGVPAVALAISYLAGGAATSTVLFIYLFAVLTNGPFLMAVLALMAGAVALPRMMSGFVHRQTA